VATSSDGRVQLTLRRVSNRAGSGWKAGNTLYPASHQTTIELTDKATLQDIPSSGPIVTKTHIA
jgi:hypothetical protein